MTIFVSSRLERGRGPHTEKGRTSNISAIITDGGGPGMQVSREKMLRIGVATRRDEVCSQEVPRATRGV